MQGRTETRLRTRKRITRLLGGRTGFTVPIGTCSGNRKTPPKVG